MVKRRSRLLALAAALIVVGAGCVWTPSFPAGKYAVTVTSDIVYGQGSINGGAATANLRLDLYKPQATGRTALPLAVVVHGGGFVGGSKTQQNVVSWARAFAGRGYIVASIEYRLAGSNPVPSTRVQPLHDAAIAAGGTSQQIAAVAAIDDTLKALDFLIARPDTIDTNPVLVGGSAGAITVDYVAYVLDEFGISAPAIGAVVSNWGGLASFAPADYVDADEPPIFMAHATGDPTVSYSQSSAIASHANAIGLAHVLYTKNAAVHGFDLAAESFAPGLSVLDAQVHFVTCKVYPVLATTTECRRF